MTRLDGMAIVVLACAPALGSAQVATATFTVSATVAPRAMIPVGRAAAPERVATSEFAVAGLRATRREAPRTPSERRATSRTTSGRREAAPPGAGRIVLVFVDGAPPIHVAGVDAR